MFNISKKTSVNYAIGWRGEKLAADFLIKKNYRLVVANFTLPIGRNRRGTLVSAEIDLIAYDKQDLCFIEVKTRRNAEVAPESAVNLRKQRQITRAAKAYRKIFHLPNVQCRFDVISVHLNDDIKNYKIEHFLDFWREDKFRQSSWLRSNLIQKLKN